MRWRRALSGLAVVLVAGIAAWVSYGHMRTLAATHGQEPVSAALLPLSADGLVAVAALAMAVDRAAGCRRRPWALLGFWLGVAVSVAANWLATSGGVIAHVISAWAPLAFLVAVEILTQAPKPRHDTAPEVVHDDSEMSPEMAAELAALVDGATTPAATLTPATEVVAPAPRVATDTATRRRARHDATLAVAEAVMREMDGDDCTDIVREIALREGRSERTAQRHYHAILNRWAADAARVDETADEQLTLA